MRFFALPAVLFASLTAVGSEIAPIPDSEQAALALKILHEYDGARDGTSVKRLHVVLFTPKDREPESNYQERLTAILQDIRLFYRDGMEKAGFGPETFALDQDNGKVAIHVVKSATSAESEYHKPDGDKVLGECLSTLNAAGISSKRETIVIFCNLANWDENTYTFSHHSPYYGMWTQTNGLCFAVDSSILNVNDLSRRKPILDDDEYGKMSLGKFNSIFIGGIAHELGHAFALPHCGERWDEKPLGTSLMGMGNNTYRDELRGEDKGSFLTMASAMRLAGRPLFRGSDKGMEQVGRLESCDLKLSTNVTGHDLKERRAAIRLEGTVTGSPPIYGVAAYFDSIHDGGYQSPAATSVPNADGEFAIEVSDLAPTESGDLRVEFCHANGAVTVRHLDFTVDAAGRVDISNWQTRRELEPLGKAVADGDAGAVDAALEQLEKSDASQSAKDVGSKLAETIRPVRKPRPADVLETVSKLALGDAQPNSAKVGWLSPSANRVPLENGIQLPFLDSNRLYATGLYAHAPSRYVFDLGGKWKELNGAAGLHTLHQPYGSVVFQIKTEGREAFRSPIINSAAHASYKIDVTGVTLLELITAPAGETNHNAWGLWLDPELER